MLTKRQQQVYDFIVQSIKRGRPPTYEEITDEIGARSKAAASVHLATLKKKGYITITSGARGIRLVNQGTCPACGRELGEKS